ncbi:MAG: transposase [Steroidobacteraceae bacterium]
MIPSARAIPTGSWSAIWSGAGRSGSAGMTERGDTDQFYRFLCKRRPKASAWPSGGTCGKAFRTSTHRNASQAAILFDKFHVMKHLGEALDKIRKAEYARLSGKQRQFIKGQKYTLLAHPQNLTGSARKNPAKLLLAANQRLNTAYLLKESFGQLWDYNREAWRESSSRTGERA